MSQPVNMDILRITATEIFAEGVRKNLVEESMTEKKFVHLDCFVHVENVLDVTPSPESAMILASAKKYFIRAFFMDGADIHHGITTTLSLDKYHL